MLQLDLIFSDPAFKMGLPPGSEAARSEEERPRESEASSLPGKNSQKHLVLDILLGTNKKTMRNEPLLGRIWERIGMDAMQVRTVFLVRSSNTPLTYGPSLAISRHQDFVKS